MVIAASKTEFMCFGEDAEQAKADQPTITLDDCPLNFVDSFKYLGHMLSSDPNKDTIGHKIGSAWEDCAKYKHILLDHEVPLNIYVRILEATVRSRLTYSLQAKLLNSNKNRRVSSI